MTALLPPTVITTAVSNVTTSPMVLNGAPRNLVMQATLAYGSGGTTINAYVQTTFDGGLTWSDVANFSLTTSSARTLQSVQNQASVLAAAAAKDGSITANTAVDGLLGPQLRVKYSSTGTYAGATTLRIDIASIELPAFP